MSFILDLREYYYYTEARPHVKEIYSLLARKNAILRRLEDGEPCDKASEGRDL